MQLTSCATSQVRVRESVRFFLFFYNSSYKKKANLNEQAENEATISMNSKFRIDRIFWSVNVETEMSPQTILLLVNFHKKIELFSWLSRIWSTEQVWVVLQNRTQFSLLFHFLILMFGVKRRFNVLSGCILLCFFQVLESSLTFFSLYNYFV